MAAKKKTVSKMPTQKVSDKPASPLRVGNKVLIRTVTHAHLGQIVEFGTADILLDQASWIADTGRFGAALQSGVFSDKAEVELFAEPVLVSRGSIVDITTWLGELPTVSQ